MKIIRIEIFVSHVPSVVVTIRVFFSFFMTWGLMWLIPFFLRSILSTIICLFVFFGVILWLSIFRITATDDLFGNFCYMVYIPKSYIFFLDTFLLLVCFDFAFVRIIFKILVLADFSKLNWISSYHIIIPYIIFYFIM